MVSQRQRGRVRPAGLGVAQGGCECANMRPEVEGESKRETRVDFYSSVSYDL